MMAPVLACIEWVGAVLGAGELPLSAYAAAFVAMLALWCIAGALYACADYAVARLAFKASGSVELAAWLRDRARAAWRERHQIDDSERLRVWVSWSVTLLLWLDLSAVWVWYLVEYRHGAVLIALTSVGGQLPLLAIAFVLGRVFGRAAAGARRALLRHPWGAWLSLPALWIAGSALVLGLGTWTALRFTDVLLETDAASIGLPLSFVLVYPFALLGRRPAGWRWAWIAVPLALGVLWAALQSPGARMLTLREASASKYAVAALMEISDLDRDGAASFPVWSDCAPLDPAVNPQAAEIPGNGLDENCDGSDHVTLFSRRKHADFKLPPGPRPNLVLITFDATRADHVGFMGYRRPTTPHLDALARRSAVFTRAFSQDSGTGPSLWSLHTGRTPFQVELLEPERFPPMIAESERTLAEQLRAFGYHTEGILCGGVFDSPRFGVRRGFDRVRNVCGRANTTDLASRVTDQALAALTRMRRPYFLWVHYYDPHGAYDAHPEFDFGAGKEDRYDAEIRYADEHLGRLLEQLTKQDPAHPTYIAMSADHGENFGEHGTDPHARNLYKVVTHVPLVVHGPGVVQRHVKAPVAMSDLYPTFLELAQVPRDLRSTMTSLAPVLFGREPDRERVVFQENSYSRPRHDTKGAVLGRHHYIMDLTTGVDELYDFEADPEERKNLVGRELPAEQTLRDAVRQFLSTTHVPENLSK